MDETLGRDEAQEADNFTYFVLGLISLSKRMLLHFDALATVKPETQADGASTGSKSSSRKSSRRRDSQPGPMLR